MIKVKEQIADAQERNDGSSELTLRKSSIPSASSQETYSTLETHNVAMQSISYGGGMRAIAATTTAAFTAAGLITEVDKSLAVDHNKVKITEKRGGDDDTL